MTENFHYVEASYRETIMQTTEVERDVSLSPPMINLDQFYDLTYSTDYCTRERVCVSGANGELNISISTGPFGFLTRVRQAYDLIRGKNINIQGGGPKKEELQNHPVVQQYLADSKAFNDFKKQLKREIWEKQTEIISDRSFRITAQGIEEIL